MTAIKKENKMHPSSRADSVAVGLRTSIPRASHPASM